MSAAERRLAALTPDDLVQGLRRYQWPLMVSVGVLVVALAFPGTPSQQFDFGGDLTGVAPYAGRQAGGGGAAAAGADVALSATDPTVGAAPGLAYETLLAGPAASSGTGGSAPPTSAPTPTTTTTTTTTPTTVPSSEPLVVTDGGWAQSALSSDSEVPADGLPVETRVGETTRVSWVRLSGTETTLFLIVRRATPGPLGEVPAVRACPITRSDWESGGEQAMEDAPAYDASACVDGRRGGNAMSFDLQRFPNRAGGNGFVLVPITDVGVTFEIVLSRASE
ncbi:MAG TPA: hypothetical protein VHF47_02970 [Acidimicrobiales bacterium]|nr:hypothetical protein [Acidimicrobiales bacterium]